MVSSEDMADKMCIQHATFELGGRKIEMKKSLQILISLSYMLSDSEKKEELSLSYYP